VAVNDAGVIVGGLAFGTDGLPLVWRSPNV
jgi:hypothetical protein